MAGHFYFPLVMYFYIQELCWKLNLLLLTIFFKLILFSFFFNFIFIILFSYRLSREHIKYIISLTLKCSIFFCVYILINLFIYSNMIIVLNFGNWISFDTLSIDWEFNIDSMNIFLIFVVVLISSLVHFYSFDYMENDPNFARFMSYLSLFTVFMLFLVCAGNFIIMFIGWEGVGLASYLLINFWYTRIQANKAAIKAMIINKIGDFALLVGMVLIFRYLETLTYHEVFLLSYLYKNKMDLICFFIFIGCMGKSAQIGLHMWLPDAMEGPTPVSALIHAATMVTAGVFLVIKCSFMFEFAELVLIFISIVGALTSFFGASVGLIQYDIKKIIAYSTCSQLGLMFVACGLSAYSISYFHLINHAFFKALLFLCAGSIIHSLNDEQDIRKMGGLKNILPFTYVSMLIASLALIGFPFFSGFYSKEAILFVTYLDNFKYSYLKFIIIYITSIITVLYSLKLLYKVFFNKPLGYKKKYILAHEAKPIVLKIYSILIFFSIFSGILLKDIFIGYGSVFFADSIFYLPKHYMLSYIEFIPSYIKLLILFIPFIGFFIFTFIKNYEFDSFKYYYLFLFFNKKYFFDRVINTISFYMLNLSYNLFYKVIDKGMLEYIIKFFIKNIDFISNFKLFRNNFNMFTYLKLFIYVIVIFFIGFYLYHIYIFIKPYLYILYLLFKNL